MEWKELLTNSRLGKEEKYPYNEERYPTTDIVKDYEKIIKSAAFRRLQDKTQVFPLEKSDFIRTRLTHSIETSTIAKRLAGMIIKNINIFKNSDLHKIDEEIATDIENIMMCAGLLHDLGNPPFGHFGEVVIGDWFQKHLSDENFCFRGIPVSSYLTDQMKNDLINFDGNAQTLRIVTRLDSLTDDNGMNLTKSLLNTLIKYPSSSLEFDSKNKNIKLHKLGYFYSEKEKFDTITNATKTIDDKGVVSRHPLTYILEAADDIAYATADLEDAYKKRLFTVNEFIKFFKESLEKRKSEMQIAQYNKTMELILNLDEMTKNKGESIAFYKWVEYVRHWLIYSAAYGFTNNYKNIMDGSYEDDIMKGTFHEYSLKIMKKDIMGKFVYNNSSIIKLELAAQTIITSLLDKFIPAVLEFNENVEGYNQSKAEKRLTNLISENYKSRYIKDKTNDECYNLYLRLLLVTDYISGMTDTYAKDLYQELQGIY